MIDPEGRPVSDLPSGYLITYWKGPEGLREEVEITVFEAVNHLRACMRAPMPYWLYTDPMGYYGGP